MLKIGIGTKESWLKNDVLLWPDVVTLIHAYRKITPQNKGTILYFYKGKKLVATKDISNLICLLQEFKYQWAQEVAEDRALIALEQLVKEMNEAP